MLVKEGHLIPTLKVLVGEQVAKLLHLLGYNVSHHELFFFFRSSHETNFHYLHNVLQAIVKLVDKFLTQPDSSQIPSEIFSSNRFYPYINVIKCLLITILLQLCVWRE